MRIVHICLTGPYSDGFNYQENMLSKFNKKNGHDVFIIASRWKWSSKGDLEIVESGDYIDKDGVQIIRLPMRGRENINKKFKRFRTLNEKLIRCKPDIIFIHNLSFLDLKTITKYLKSHKNVLCYADNHADFSNSGRSFLSRKILHGFVWKHYSNMIEPYIKTFFGVLPARVSFLIDVYKLPATKCKLLLMGGDDELIANGTEGAEELRNKYHMGKNDFVIVTGGKIDKWKVQTIYLARAVSKINNANLKLLIFGSISSEIKDELLSLCNDRIIYVGWINSDESYKYFAAADLVVFPGRHSVFWEQVVSQGKPLICKDIPGTHHIDIGGNVIFLKHGEENEILQVLEELLKVPEKYKCMKESAMSSDRKKFFYNEISNSYVK